MQSRASLSIIVPCFNEEETIEYSYTRLNDLCLKWQQDGLIFDYELIFVNDGSRDKTLASLLYFYEKNNRVVIVDFRANYGFQSAISAGIFSARHEMVVSIDADLQDDPNKIAEMIQKYYEGFEMVLGVRENRDTDSFGKRLFAQTYYRFLRLIGVASVYNHADFRLLSRDLIEELKKFPERVRYLRSLIFLVESKYACVYYKRVPRQLGKSKFSFFKSFSLALDGITSFSNKPIKILSFLGLAMFVLSFVGFLVVILVKYWFRTSIPGWASLSIIILFFSGIQNLSLSVVGEYVAKIYLEAKARPIYIIRREYRHN